MAIEDSSLVLLDFQTLLEAAPDGIAVADERGRIVLANEEFSRLFAYETGELVGSPVESLVPARFREEHQMHRSNYHSQPPRSSKHGKLCRCYRRRIPR